MRKLTRKRILLPVVAVAAALAVAGAALAFFTASGTGSGTGSVGTDAGISIDPVTITGTLYPGGSATVSFTVNNLSTSTKVKVGQVVADTSGGNTNGISSLPAGCSASDFHFDPVTVNSELDPSGTAAGQGTLSMDNTSVSQNACKGAQPVLHLKVDNSGL
jgi:hypothetical protein